MIKPSIRVQDLRWGIYAKQKADSTGTDGVGSGGINPRRGTVRPESTTSVIGHINLGEKPAGQPNMGKPYVGLEVAGAGNVTMGAGLRTTRKVWRNHRTLRCARQLSTLLTADPLRRGDSDSMVTRTRRATGEAFLAPAGKSWRRICPITRETGKWVEGERAADGSVVATKRGNACGAKGPCCW